MPATESRRTPDQLAELGSGIFDHRVRSILRPEDDDKFVAIDVESGEFEIDEDDYTAVMRLRARCPASGIWLARVGQPATYRMGRSR